VERQGNPADFPGGDRQEEIGRARRRWHPEGVDLELHQLELPHADLRIDDPGRRRRFNASLAELGQQVPVVVVVAAAGGHGAFKRPFPRKLT
jgi:hypothetical protein